MAFKSIMIMSLFSRLYRYVCNNETMPDLTKLSADERLELKIKYIDFMLADMHPSGKNRIHYYLYRSDLTLGEGLHLNYEYINGLSEWEKALVLFCQEVVKVTWKLNALDLRAVELLGFCRQDKISAYNRRLSKFLTETPYRHIACLILEGMTARSLSEAARMGYQPAQDYLAELPYINKLDDCKDTDIKKRLHALRQYEWHLKSGQKQGFTTEEIITHDEIYGFFMNRFEPTVMTSARRIARFIGEEMPKHVKGYVVEDDLYYQPKEVKREIADGVKRVAEFVRKERDKYFAEGWLDDDSIAFSYLMAHAERIAVESAEKRR